MSFDPGSRSKLTARDMLRFEGDTLFQRVARQVCAAECLPRKELYESWEVARRARRRFRGGRIVDLACGHALLAQLLLILDDSSSSALAVDRRIPESARNLGAALARAWPRISGRIELVEAELTTLSLLSSDLLVSCHACGSLTDEILTMAIAARARIVVLPCCHDKVESDAGGLTGWLDSALAVDVTRAARLRNHNYTVHTQTIPQNITPKNRLLLAEPL